MKTKFPLLGALPALAAVVALALAGCSKGAGGGGSGTTDPAALAAPTYLKSYSVAGADVAGPQVSPLPDGGHMMTGVIQSGWDNGRLLLARLDAEGNVAWARRIGDESRLQLKPGDYPLTTTVMARGLPDGSVWAIGTSPGGAAAVRLGADGAVTDVVDLPAGVDLKDLVLVPSGQLLIVGEVGVGGGSDDRRLWTARISPSARQLISTDTPTPAPADGTSEYVHGVSVDSGGSFVVFGRRGRDWTADYWVASFTAEGRLRFSDTHTDDGFGERLWGRVRAAAFVGRFPGSVGGSRWVTVGQQTYSRTEYSNLDSKLIVLDASSGDERQNLTVDNAPDAFDRYFDVFAGPGPDDIRVLGSEGGCFECPPAIRLEQYRRSGESYARTGSRVLVTGASYGEAAAFGSDGHPLVLREQGDRGSPELLKFDANNPSAVVWQHPLGDLRDVLSRARDTSDKFGNKRDAAVRVVGTPDGGALLVMPNGVVSVAGDGSRRFAKLPPPSRVGYAYTFVDTDPRTVLSLPGGGSVLLTSPNDTTLRWLRHDDQGQLLTSLEFGGFGLIGAMWVDANGDGRRDDHIMVLTSDSLVRLRPDGSVVDRRRLPEGYYWGRLVDGPAGAMLVGLGMARAYRPPMLLRLNAAGEPTATWTWIAPGDPASTELGLDDAALAADGTLHLASRAAGGTAQLRSFAPDGSLRLRATFSVANGSALAPVAVAALPDGRVSMQAGIDQHAADPLNPLASRALDNADGLAWRVEPDGRVAWVRRYGTARTDLFGLGSLAGRDNGVLALGVSTGFNSPAASVLVGRLDADGRVSGACQAEQPAPELRVSTTPTPGGAPEGAMVVGPAPTLVADSLPAAGAVIRIEQSALTMQAARACSGIAQAPGLVVEVSGPGLVDSQPVGIACRAGQSTGCAQAYPSGGSVALNATPDAGARFVGWGGDCASAAGGLAAVIRMDQPRRCTARFEGANTPPPPPPPAGSCRADAPLVGNWQDAGGGATPVAGLGYGLDATLRGGLPLVAVSTGVDAPAAAHRPWVAQWTGTTWSRLGSDADPMLPGFAGAPQIRANASAVWLAWAYTDFSSADGDPPNRLAVRMHDGSSWRELPRPVAQPSGTLVRWWLLLPADGAPVVAWQEPLRQRVQLLRWNGSTWDRLEPLEAPQDGGLWALATDASGTRLGAVWAGVPAAATTELRSWVRSPGAPGTPWVARSAGTLPGPGAGAYMSDLQLVLDGERMDAALQRSDSSGRAPAGGPFVVGRQATGNGAWAALGDAGLLYREPDFGVRPVGLQLLDGCGGAPWLAWRDDLNYPASRLWAAQSFGLTSAAWQALGGEVVPQASVSSQLRVLSASDGSAWAVVVRATASPAGSNALRPELRLQRFVPGGG